MAVSLEGGSPSANLMEVKASKPQGLGSNARSEGSGEQIHNLMNKNRIGGAEVGRVVPHLQSPYPSRTRGVRPAGAWRKRTVLPREIRWTARQGWGGRKKSRTSSGSQLRA